ncbi:MAG: alpha-L-fucosidase [Clostridia bacterium]|nr:alpha-L-fucosidase [Clostridia bacterium]
MNAQDRMMQKKWGIFNHYLYYSEKGYHFGHEDPAEENAAILRMAEEWNEQIDSFDTEKLARTLHEIGCGYYMITVMQGTRFMLAPNETYSRITGIRPGEACPRRDLIRDIALSLQKYDIDLYLYYTGDGPHFDKIAGPRMGLYEDYEAGIHGKVDRRFVENWAAVLGEYAARYGDLVKGWWVDGCYAHLGYNNELLSIYFDALKKGNPDVLAAFNSGTASFVSPDGDDTPIKWYENEGFTCGEDNDFTYVFKTRFTDGAQNHLLIPLGEYRDGNICNGWRSPGVRRSKEYVADYIRRNNAAGAVITVDIFVDCHGNFDPAQVEALTYVGQKVRE